MKASNILKTLFTCSVQEYILGANSCKSAVQRVNLVEKILDQLTWTFTIARAGARLLLVTKFF